MRRAVLQRPVRRRLRQYLCLHRRRAEPAATARLRRGRPHPDPDDPECRQGRSRRRAGRGDLSRILDPPDRRARHRPADGHRQRCRRRTRSRRRASSRPGPERVSVRVGGQLHLRREPAGDQSAGQRPLLPADATSPPSRAAMSIRRPRCSASTASRRSGLRSA